MATTHGRRERVSIDVNPEEHKRIKVCAALHGTTIREYVMECVRGRLVREKTTSEAAFSSSGRLDKDPVLKNLWDNDKDAAYDKL